MSNVQGIQSSQFIEYLPAVPRGFSFNSFLVLLFLILNTKRTRKQANRPLTRSKLSVMNGESFNNKNSTKFIFCFFQNV